MPIAVRTVTDASPEEIAREVAAAAAAVIADPPLRPGDAVRIVNGELIARIPLLSDIGVVTGYLPVAGGTASVMCAWGNGTENQLQLQASDLRRV